MSDETAAMRQYLIDSGQADKDLAGADKTWTTSEMTAEFEVLGFLAPYVVVRRKSDSKTGSLQFRHSPRVYFGWQEDKP